MWISIFGETRYINEVSPPVFTFYLTLSGALRKKQAQDEQAAADVQSKAGRGRSRPNSRSRSRRSRLEKLQARSRSPRGTLHASRQSAFSFSRPRACFPGLRVCGTVPPPLPLARCVRRHSVAARPLQKVHHTRNPSTGWFRVFNYVRFLAAVSLCTRVSANPRQT